MTASNYVNYLYVAIRAALDAGKAIMDIYTDPESDFEIERKADNSPLTKADKRANHIISTILSATPFPILSEEGKEIPYTERKKWETLWIVDPLDGTKEFIKRNGEFTVNIALVKAGVPLLGVIYVPVRRELYYAEPSKGAYKLIGIDSNSQPAMEAIWEKAVRLPLAMGHQGLVVVASRSHQTDETVSFIEPSHGLPVARFSISTEKHLCDTIKRTYIIRGSSSNRCDARSVPFVESFGL